MILLNSIIGEEIIEEISLEKWMEDMKAPTLEPLLVLYNQLKLRGMKIFIITGQSKYLRDVTTQNLGNLGG